VQRLLCRQIRQALSKLLQGHHVSSIELVWPYNICNCNCSNMFKLSHCMSLYTELNLQLICILCCLSTPGSGNSRSSWSPAQLLKIQQLDLGRSDAMAPFRTEFTVDMLSRHRQQINYGPAGCGGISFPSFSRSLWSFSEFLLALCKIRSRNNRDLKHRLTRNASKHL
jgi:hypothetical protein